MVRRECCIEETAVPPPPRSRRLPSLQSVNPRLGRVRPCPLLSARERRAADPTEKSWGPGKQFGEDEEEKASLGNLAFKDDLDDLVPVHH